MAKSLVFDVGFLKVSVDLCVHEMMLRKVEWEEGVLIAPDKCL